MKRRTLLAGGATITGLGIAGCYALVSDDGDDGDGDEPVTNDTDDGDSREDQEADGPIASDEEPPGEVEEDTNNSRKYEDGESPHSKEYDEQAENRPDDATDTVEITSHDIVIEEYPEQDYNEVYVTGELQTGDYALASVQVDAVALDGTGETIGHEFTQLAEVGAETTAPFEVPLYVEPSQLDSYKVAVTAAEYAG